MGSGFFYNLSLLPKQYNNSPLLEEIILSMNIPLASVVHYDFEDESVLAAEDNFRRSMSSPDPRDKEAVMMADGSATMLSASAMEDASFLLSSL